MNKRQGFSLLETLVVVSLFSLLLVVAAWGTSGIARSQGPRSLAEELAGRVQDLRSQAQSQETYTALGWSVDSQGVARGCFTLEGRDRARFKQKLAFAERYPDLVAFCGRISGSESWPPLQELESGPLNLPAWAHTWSNHPLWVFTPTGDVVGLNWPQQNGVYRCLLARGARASSETLDGRSVARLQGCHRGVCLQVVPGGAVAVQSLEVPGLDSGVALAPPPSLAPPGEVATSTLRLSDLQLTPQQNPDLLPTDNANPRQARVEPESYLHFKVVVQGTGPGPLTCEWTLPQLRGRTSSRAATVMSWNGQNFESTWEWQAPADSLPGDRVSIQCRVRDGLGRIIPAEVEASIDVEIIKTGRVLFSSQRDGQPDLYMVNQDGSRLRRLTRDPVLEGRPHLSPDGTRIFYARSGQLLLTDGQGEHPQVLLAGGSFIEPVWNPLGTRIAVNRRRPGIGDELVLIDADPQNPHVEVVGTFPIEGLGFTDWSPDNSRLVYNTVSPGGSRLYEYIFDGARHRPLRPSASPSESQPRFSPDGQWLAYSRRGQGQIYVSRYLWDSPSGDGRLENDEARVTEGPWNSDPAWSPDGAFLIFGSRRPGGTQDEERIWIQAVSSGTARRLSTPGNARDWDPTWGR